MIAKHAKYEEFKKQQRLHPEYAGVYAEAFLANKEMHHFQELRVFWQVGARHGQGQLAPHKLASD